MIELIRNRLLRMPVKRPPDFVIGGHEKPYLQRWFVIPRNPLFNIYLHRFLRSDDDRALHDHPWLFNASWLLIGRYREIEIDRGGIVKKTLRMSASIKSFKFRFGKAPHRLELISHGDIELPCITLFITGPRIRDWGFYCADRGWIHWKQFTSEHDSGEIGRGCDG